MSLWNHNLIKEMENINFKKEWYKIFLRMKEAWKND